MNMNKTYTYILPKIIILSYYLAEGKIKLKKKTVSRAGEVVQKVKMTAAKPDGLRRGGGSGAFGLSPLSGIVRYFS